MVSDVKKVQRGPIRAAAIQSVGAGLPTQATGEGTEMSVAEVLLACPATRSHRMTLGQEPVRAIANKGEDGAVPGHDGKSTFKRVCSLRHRSTCGSKSCHGQAAFVKSLVECD
jgi:hypothetical protein